MSKPNKPTTAAVGRNDLPSVGQLITDIRSVIEHARQQASTAVNASQTYMYWRIGQRIHAELLGGERAPYGAQIVATVSRQLVAEYGRGFTEKNLRRMVQFAQTYPDEKIVATLWRQLSWSHFREILPLDKPYQRDFYAEMCRIEGWSVRTLRERIDSMLYERTALSKKPDELIQQELATLRSKGEVAPALVLKDPYLLDFLGLTDRFLERDLEDAILRELETFLLELGAGFSFVARQKRIQLDGDDFYIDLLFYNRKLKRLVVVELKQGAFKAEYKGQMELYLRWLAKHEQEPDENPPLGIILCAGKNTEQIELLELDASGIHVAEYLTVLPPPDVLRRKLHEAIETARARINAKDVPEKMA
jgi:predicted nuclease of restriction endonuclease-like (RecB) superfamily